MGKAIRITVDGDWQAVDMPDGDTLHWLYEQIGCRCVDLVRLDGELDMWLDDEGMYVNDGENVNMLATALNLAMGNLHPALWGTMIITRHNGEGDTTSLTDDDIGMLNGILRYFKGALVDAGLIEVKAAADPATVAYLN
jgi:hypothetical protein